MYVGFVATILVLNIFFLFAIVVVGAAGISYVSSWT
jgi:hypothetical protein